MKTIVIIAITIIVLVVNTSAIDPSELRDIISHNSTSRLLMSE